VSLLDELTEDLRIAVSEQERKARVEHDARIDRIDADLLVADLRTAIAALEPAPEAEQGQPDGSSLPEDGELQTGGSVEAGHGNLNNDGAQEGNSEIPLDWAPMPLTGAPERAGYTLELIADDGSDFFKLHRYVPAKPAPVNSTDAATETVEGEQTEPEIPEGFTKWTPFVSLSPDPSLVVEGLFEDGSREISSFGVWEAQSQTERGALIAYRLIEAPAEPERVVIDDQLADPELEPFVDEPEAEAVTEEPEEEAPTTPATGWSSYWAKKPEPVS
jgi:hypothetical protein